MRHYYRSFKRTSFRSPRRFFLRTVPFSHNPNSIVYSPILLLFIFTLAIISSWSDWGKIATYPFELLSTWAHETAHGVAALLVGGNLQEFIITPNLGGLATTHNYNTELQGIVVKGAGYIGSSLIGTFLLIWSRNFRSSGIALAFLAASLFATGLWWSGDSFTRVSCLSFGGAVGLTAIIGNEPVRATLAQFIAAQFSVQGIVSLKSAYFETGTVAGHTYLTDTAGIATIVGGTAEFWATVLTVLSLLILWIGVCLPNVGVRRW